MWFCLVHDVKKYQERYQTHIQEVERSRHSSFVSIDAIKRLIKKQEDINPNDGVRYSFACPSFIEKFN